jgi:hypothetical protein
MSHMNQVHEEALTNSKRTNGSIKGYLTSLFSICKKFGTWNPFVNVIYINPLNQKL